MVLLFNGLLLASKGYKEHLPPSYVMHGEQKWTKITVLSCLYRGLVRVNLSSDAVESHDNKR